MEVSASINIESESLTKSDPKWIDEIPTIDLDEWQVTAIKGVLRASNLPDNWDSYGSPSPSENVVATAINLISSIHFHELPVPNVGPVSGGGIQFEWTIGTREVELEVVPDGSLEFLQLENGEPLNERQLKNYPQLHSLLAWLIPG